MSELCPRGFEYLFFGLFGTANRASSIMGPIVIQKFIDSSHGNLWMGFPFLFALGVVATLSIWFGVNIEKGRRDAEAFTLVNALGQLHGTSSEDTDSGPQESQRKLE
jgi:MFS-type transporter involved in bile tolerance (Atg22 family)